MKNKKEKVIRWGLLILWMAVIFIMSQQNGENSSEQSRFVILIFSSLGIDINGQFGELSTFIVRKAAHFTEYFILFVLSYRTIKLYYQDKKSMILVIAFVFIYASSDEFHQSFVPGRGPAFRDVLVDTSGGVFAGICIGIKNKIRSRVKKDTVSK
ncbi:MAG: VanZ family protein [Clostridium sp.]|nr:VanZ family protein [Clostridium sp.]